MKTIDLKAHLQLDMALGEVLQNVALIEIVKANN